MMASHVILLFDAFPSKNSIPMLFFVDILEEEGLIMNEKENLYAFFNHQPHEWMPGEEAFWQPKPTRGIFERPTAGGAGRDWFGCLWEADASGISHLATPSAHEHLIEDITEWKDIVKFPDLDAFDWEAALERDKVATAPRETHVINETILEGCWERMNAFMGIEGSMIAIMEEPEACLDFFNAIADYKIKLVDKIMEYYKPEVITYHDDWGTQTGPFFRPSLWRELLKEPTQRVWEHIHSYGIPVIFHCCGKYDALIPEICEMGCDVLECMDILDISAAIEATGGNMSFWVSPHAQQYFILNETGELTEEMVREEFGRELEEWGKSGVYAPHFLYNAAWYDATEREVYQEYLAKHRA